MYNEELKNRFMAGYGNSGRGKAAVRDIFRAFEPYEKKRGTDLCALSVEEIESAIDEIKAPHTSNEFFQLMVLKDYSKWCVAQKVPGACDAASQIQANGADTVRKQMVSGPAELQRYLDIVFDDAAKQTTDIRCRTYLWLAFSGVKEEDVLKIRSDDIDLPAMRIYLPNGGACPIYPEASLALYSAATLKDFAFFHPYYTGERRKRVDSDILLRGIKSNGSITAIRAEVSDGAAKANERGETTQRLSYNRVYMSGEFFRAYEDEQAGCEVSFRKFAEKESPNLKKEYLRRKASDYKRDYLQWKLTFKY